MSAIAYNFAAVPNDYIQNPCLSLKAKGMLSILISLPSNFHINVQGLMYFTKESKTSVTGALKELELAGILKRTKIRTEDGRTHYQYEIFCPNPMDKKKSHHKEKKNAVENAQGIQSSTGSAKENAENAEGKELSTQSVEKTVENAPVSSSPLPENPYTVNRTLTKTLNNKNAILDFSTCNPELQVQSRSSLNTGLFMVGKYIPAVEPKKARLDHIEELDELYWNLGIDSKMEAPVIGTIYREVWKTIEHVFTTRQQFILLGNKKTEMAKIRAAFRQLHYRKFDYVCRQFGKYEHDTFNRERYIITLLLKPDWECDWQRVQTPLCPVKYSTRSLWGI